MSTINSTSGINSTGATDTSIAENKGKKKLIRLGEFRIEGTIQKPQAFYILQRSNLNFEGLELKNNFIPKILQSVENIK